MTQAGRLLLVAVALLASGLAAGGYGYQRGQARLASRLTRISALADQLNINNERRVAANAAMGRSIAHVVCLNHCQPADVAVLAQAQQIQARTKGLVDTIALLHKRLRSAATGPHLVSSLFTQLDRYAVFIRHYTPEAAPFARPSAIADWLGQVELGKLPLPAALATLAQLDAWLRRGEAQALQTQAEKMSNHYDGFDAIHILAVPATETVAPSGPYQARLFLAECGHRDFCNMEMTANGKPLTQPNAPGMQVQFAVPARRPGQPDTVRAHWHGTIRGPLFPRDTILELDVPYLIVQPRTP